MQRPPSALPEGFALPDWGAPLDVEAHLTRIPPDATAKGLFLQALLAEAERHGKPLPAKQAYDALGDYPIRHGLEQLVNAAQLLHPELPLRDGIRHLAWLAYGAFADSLLGRALFGALGRQLPLVLSLAGRGVAHAANVGSVETERVADDAVILRATDFYAFLDCFGVGVVEGLLQRCGRTGLVAVRLRSPIAGDLYVRWSDESCTARPAAERSSP